MLKPISLKVEENQLRMLEIIAEDTSISKSNLIREGIDLVIRRHQEDVITAEFRKEIDDLIQEDKELLKRLAE